MASKDTIHNSSSSQSDTEVGENNSKHFLDELQDCFGTSELYEVLQLSDKSCDITCLRKAYHKLSIKIHPDRVSSEDREGATHKFQLLGRVYQTLSDPARRREYDKFGVIQMESEMSCPEGADSWEEYWKVIYPKILLEEVDKFSKQYRESEDELSDLKQCYRTNEGDMDMILESMMCSVYSDDDRFRSLLTPFIGSGELPVYEKFTESKKKQEKRKRKAIRESEEAKQLQKELGIDFDNESSLIAKIRSHGKNRVESFLNNLEDKYSTESEAKKVRVDRKQSKILNKIAMKTPTKKRQSSIETLIDLTTPKLIQNIDLTTPKVVLCKPKRLTDIFIDEIVISDSDDESPPKRIKDCQTPFYTPNRSKSTSCLYKKHDYTSSPRYQLTRKDRNAHHKFSPTNKPNFNQTQENTFKKLNSPLNALPNNVKQSTPKRASSSIHVSRYNGLVQISPSLTPITYKQDENGCDYDSNQFHNSDIQFSDLLPTDVTTVELFASNYKSPLRKSRISKYDESSSLPELNFLRKDNLKDSSTSSQLAERLKIVGLTDKHSLTSPASADSNFENFQTPRSNWSDEVFLAPTPILFSSHISVLTLEKLESNRKLYTTPDYIYNFTPEHDIEGSELPNEWIDDTINLPLEGQTSFVKINSLQFVRACITTPRIIISTTLLSPLVTYLVTTQDVTTIIQTATLLCDVIKTHPASTFANAVCYQEIFTWDLLLNSIQTLCNKKYIEVTHDCILKLYCDVIESELAYSQPNSVSFTQSLFWPKSRCNLSDNFKDFTALVCTLISKPCPLIHTLFRMLGLVLECARKNIDSLWLNEAAKEFHKHLTEVKSNPHTHLLDCINPPWFAGYMAQLRLQEIGVSPSNNKCISPKLRDFFTNYTNFLPKHSVVESTETTISNSLKNRLIKASQLGDCNNIRKLILSGCEPNVFDDKNWNSLLRACWYGKVSSIEAIVETSLDTEKYFNIIQSRTGVTPLHLAAKYGNIDVCVCLLKLGGPSLLLHLDKYGNYPFQVATDKKLIKLLKIGYDEQKFEAIASSIGFNSKLRVPIEMSVIHEFESMLCIALRGIVNSGDFNQDDVIACKGAQSFLDKLTSQINKSQLQLVELTRLQALITSYF
ncbi:DnaJ-like protein subfamily C member 9 [Oopsacas minuta]|uniref:DnaJ-like protein subfamily C member 9 n=1 Tax=Oopsacas minuta TaxID=111878 RepID=A0AAV7JUK9_9METZ|nr:DnaJ-like protein subfamily C member 9 [Oopsacas minuta]